MSIDDFPGHLDCAERANAITRLRALAGDVRELLRDPTLFDDDVADIRTAEQALERAAARHETAP